MANRRNLVTLFGAIGLLGAFGAAAFVIWAIPDILRQHLQAPVAQTTILLVPVIGGVIGAGVSGLFNPDRFGPLRGALVAFLSLSLFCLLSGLIFWGLATFRVDVTSAMPPSTILDHLVATFYFGFIFFGAPLVLLGAVGGLAYKHKFSSPNEPLERSRGAAS